jgi:hypothetical protein
MLTSFARKKLRRQDKNVTWDKFLVSCSEGAVCWIKFRGGIRNILIIGGDKTFIPFMETILLEYFGVKNLFDCKVIYPQRKKIKYIALCTWDVFFKGKWKMIKDGYYVERKDFLGDAFY